MPSRRRLLQLAVYALAIAIIGGAILFAFGVKIFRPKMLPDLYRPVGELKGFDDVPEDDEDYAVIMGLAELGVIPQVSGYLLPDTPIERGDYIMWLVRAHHIFNRDDPKEWFPLAEKEDTWTFSDVTPGSMSYPYLQGMVNAGLIVGFTAPGQEYNYARNIIRERMILLRGAMELGTEEVTARPEEYENLRVHLSNLIDDAADVTDEYVPAVLADLQKGHTIELVWGNVDKLEPRKLLTRREAARSVSRMGARSWELALKMHPPWKPLPQIVQERLKKEAEEKAGDDGHDHSH